MAMLINDVSPRVEYTATAGQTAFVIPFEFPENADIICAIGGVRQTLTTDYTLTGAGVTGGGVLTLVAGAALGSAVVIRRSLKIERLTDFPTSGPFDIDELNRELDQITMILQEMQAGLDRTLILDPDAPEATAGWDAQGRRIINLGDAEADTDAANKRMSIYWASLYGGGEGGGGGGVLDPSLYYTKEEVDALIAALNSTITTSYTNLINTTITTALSNSFRIREMQTFTASGTWTKPVWCKRARFIVQAGGGGGGFAANDDTTTTVGSGGGGGACAVTDLIDVTAISTVALTVGLGGAGGIGSTRVQATAGGQSIVAGICTAEGGTGGAGMVSSVAMDGVGTVPGTGGSVSSGAYYTIPGHDGIMGKRFGEAGTGAGGPGGNSFMGKGGIYATGSVNGNGATGFGGGGGGGVNDQETTSDRNGGAGTPGKIIVEMFE